MYQFQPYPLRLTAPDGKRVRVLNKDEHDALLAEWNEAADRPADPPSAPAALASAFDHDGDGSPGGSTKPEPSIELTVLRIEYRERFGKRAFPGWKADELRTRLAAA